MTSVAPEPEKAGSLDKMHTTFNEFPQFSSASTIKGVLRAPAVQIPPPVLKDDGKINEEYFSVLAAKEGPLVRNAPATFKHDYPEDRIKRCMETQALAQEVHSSDCLDIDAVSTYISSKEKVLSVLHTIAYMNLPGPPGDNGGSMVGSGAVILTEDRIILCSSVSDKSASATDHISGTTLCTYCCPCCPGFCGCFKCCQLTTFRYEQLAKRENHDQQDTIKLSNAKVSFKVTNVTDIMRKYTVGSMPSSCSCCELCSLCYSICCGHNCTDECFYHGSHDFTYADKPTTKTVDSITKKTVGYDDTAWSLQDELTLTSLALGKKTASLFKEPDSPAFRSKMIEKFGSKFTPEQCSAKVRNMMAGLKTADVCTRKTVMTLSITHWDPASQKVRTTVCVCNPDKVTTEMMMKFQVDASGAKNSMADNSAICSGSAAPIATASMFGGGGGPLAMIVKCIPFLKK